MNKSGGQPERLSKLQKFILTACYHKTIRNQCLPVVPKVFVNESGNIYPSYFDWLYTSDIMLNFYRLTENKAKERFSVSGKTFYIESEDAKKAVTAVERSIMKLWKRGYIVEREYDGFNICVGTEIKKYVIYGKEYEHNYEIRYNSKDHIKLTPKGMEKVKSLLKVEINQG